jgi:hypothetical protein
MNEKLPRIWVLLGDRRGDNNQLLALAEAMGLPFETRTMEYRLLWALLLRLFPRSPRLLSRRARGTLNSPWPDLVVGIGRRNVAVARWIKRMNAGRTKLVRLGNPRADPALFDLVITTPQYPVPPAPNVLKLPLSMDRHSTPPRLTAEERAWLDGLERPHLLASIGGATRYLELDEDRIVAAIQSLAERARAAKGSLIIATSPRTDAATVSAISRTAAGLPNVRIVSDETVRYAVLLHDADENFVTGDSVSMISEAVLAGKPVGLIPVELDAEGQKVLTNDRFSETVRDVRRFWAELRTKGLIGTVDAPANGPVEDPVRTAVDAVRALLA